MAGNNWHRRVHPQGLHQTPFQVLHLKCVLEGRWAVRITEDLIQLFNHFVLDMLMDTHHGQEETTASSGGVVTLF